MRHRKRGFIIPLSVVWALSAAVAFADELLVNGSFSSGAPSTVAFSGLGYGGLSAADNWQVWNNLPGTTATELCTALTCPSGARPPAPPGVNPAPADRNQMLRVGTGIADSGIWQSFLPFNTGAAQTLNSAWVWVAAGQVALGVGNGELTTYEIFSSGTAHWEHLYGNTVETQSGPINQFILYSVGGPAEFYANLLSVQYSGGPSLLEDNPEPATIVLTGAGIAFLVLRLRRSRSIR